MMKFVKSSTDGFYDIHYHSDEDIAGVLVQLGMVIFFRVAQQYGFKSSDFTTSDLVDIIISRLRPRHIIVMSLKDIEGFECDVYFRRKKGTFIEMYTKQFASKVHDIAREANEVLHYESTKILPPPEGLKEFFQNFKPQPS